MRPLPLALLSLAFCATTVSSALAQNPPNLTGTWVLLPDSSDFGPMPAATARTDVIEHKGSSIVIKRTQSGPTGEVKATLTYGVDGKPYQNTIGGNDVTSTLKWDGAVLVIESTVKTPQGEASVTDRWSLSPDGKRLTQSRSLSMQGQNATQKFLLTKQ
jgi:hypothetical protein